MKTKWAAGIAAMLGAAVLVGAATSWACTRAAYVDPLSPGHGAPRTWVKVSGGSFNPTPVDIRWGSPTGSLLGRAPNGGGFAVEVKIPDAAPGVYYVVAVQTDAAGITWKRAAPFEVTGTSGSAPTSDGGGSSSQSSNSVATAAPGGTATQSPSGSPNPSATSSGDSTTTAGQTSASDGLAETSAGQSAQSSASPAPSEEAGTSGSRSAAANASASPPAAGGARVGTVAAAERHGSSGATTASVPSAEAGSGDATVAPLARTAGADLWSGFSSDGRPVSTVPSLIEPTSSPAGPDGQLLGMVSLGVGIVALGSGFLAAEAARRRALA